jgi:phosphatidylglycerophosphatase A
MAVNLRKLQGPKEWFALVLATACGAGLLPKAPGTWGSLVALPLIYAAWHWPTALNITIWLALTAGGTWAASVIDRTQGSTDNQSVVIDEVVGQWLTACLFPPTMRNLLIAFVLFRTFDIVKIFPVRSVDQWSKKMSSIPGSLWGGFGVMADDILAGIQGLLVMLLLQHLGVLT